MQLLLKKQFICNISEAQTRHIVNELRKNKCRFTVSEGALNLQNKKALEVAQELL